MFATIRKVLRWVFAAATIVALALISREALAAGQATVPGVDAITDGISDATNSGKNALKIVGGLVGLVIFVKGALQAAAQFTDEGRGQGGNVVWIIVKLVAAVILIGIALTAIG